MPEGLLGAWCHGNPEVRTGPWKQNKQYIKQVTHELSPSSVRDKAMLSLCHLTTWCFKNLFVSSLHYLWCSEQISEAQSGRGENGHPELLQSNTPSKEGFSRANCTGYCPVTKKRFHNLAGQPVPVLCYPQSKEQLPQFWFVPIAPSCVTGHHCKESGSSPWPFRYL